MEILNTRDEREVWDKVYGSFKFQPSINDSKMPFQIEQAHKIFELLACWNEPQHKIVSEIFKSLDCKNIFALDWQHDCFLFNPCEEIPFGMTWHDDTRDCQVYFPSYYPDGDYHFFISSDFSYGLLGHPWRKEIWAFGQWLIQKLEENQAMLMLQEKICLY